MECKYYFLCYKTKSNSLILCSIHSPRHILNKCEQKLYSLRIYCELFSYAHRDKSQRAFFHFPQKHS